MLKPILWMRSFTATCVFIFITFASGIAVIISAGIFDSLRVANFSIWFWAWVNMIFYNVAVTLKGEENIPDEGCLFVFNHSSHFDILFITRVLRKTHRFGAKIELFSIPVFGAAMRAAGVLPISRGERDKVLKIYENSIQRVRNGESFVLACEGTRKDHPGVGEKFKAGPFIFAIQGQFPIVPVVIKGAHECLPKGDLIACRNSWKHYGSVEILAPIPTKGLTLEDRPSLQEQIRNLMTSAYSKS